MTNHLVLVRYTAEAKAAMIAGGGFTQRIDALRAAADGAGWVLGEYWVMQSQEWDAVFFLETEDGTPATIASQVANEASGHISEWRVVPLASAADVDAATRAMTGGISGNPADQNR